MSDAVKAAEAKLWEYINGLPPAERERAVAYQSKLEAMALVTEGGMPQVILNEMRHHAAVMEEVAEEVNEMAARHHVDALVKRIQK